MRPSLSLAIALVFALFASFARRASAEPHPKVDLYTIGPSGELPSRFGHSLLCVRPSAQDTPEGGRCFDYGVGDRNEIVHLGWTLIRGIPSFVPIAIGEARVIDFYRAQGRQVEKQRIGLAAAETARLVSALEADVAAHQAYAYHPLWSNCSTKIRDHLDAATNGRLRAGSTSAARLTFREYADEGNSGRLFALVGLALVLGEPTDRVASPWEAMFLPGGLRDGVTERLAAPPEEIQERQEMVLQTSRASGRIALFVLALVLLVVVRWTAHRGRLQAGLRVLGGALGAVALLVDGAALLVTWPEVTHNWCLLLFLPTDVALLFVVPASARLRLYLKVRIAMAVAFAVLEIAGVVRQPMLPLAVLVALPMLGALSAMRERAPAARV